MLKARGTANGGAVFQAQVATTRLGAHHYLFGRAGVRRIIHPGLAYSNVNCRAFPSVIDRI
jgi:hypothetical protein